MITIFTPTYNRAYILNNLYLSLLNQTDLDFEWLIVNDGSSDNTDDYFKEISKKNNPFPIRYYFQKNKGKHVAINLGVKKAHGDLFFIVDSDDFLTHDAIKKIKTWKSTLDSSKKWAGIAGLKGFPSKKIIGKTFSGTDFVDAKNTERDLYQIWGDKSEVYFTDVLKKYPFPEIESEKFMEEEFVWNAIAKDGYFIRWFNDIIYIADYLEDGLSHDKNRHKNNPKGTLLWAKQNIEIFQHSNQQRTYSAILAYYDATKRKKSILSIIRDLDISFFLFAKSYLNACAKIPINFICSLQKK